MIETREEAAAAARLGIGFGQGFLYGRPAPQPTAALPTRIVPSRPRRAARRKGAVNRWE
jgi:EAL domain-containing protein (putative c-di-GMP-specific phosphodiesterase class I)